MGAFFRDDTKRSLSKGKGVTYTTEGPAAQGGAIWFAPGSWKLGGLELLTAFPTLLAFGRDTPRSLGLLNQVEKVHPEEPHWYLSVLGTDPAHQGKGVGSALMQPVLDRCDEEGLGAYLESSKEANIPFYRRHGFEVTTEVTIKGGGPTLWPMWRDPR
jgi:GNAT superfamily N-acetyltransferase